MGASHFTKCYHLRFTLDYFRDLLSVSIIVIELINAKTSTKFKTML